jgi:hypothetical protein
LICTKQDSYIRKLIMEDVSILWKCTLNNDITVWSDYERPGVEDNPWLRLRAYCKKADVYITKIQVVVMGAPQEVLFENPNGLDGIFIVRGTSRDIDMVTGDGPTYQHLTVGLMNDDLETVDIRKFSFPECEFEEFVQTRGLTPENAKWMMWKNGSKKKQSKQIQIALNE